MSDPLYMVQLRLDARRMVALGRERRLPLREIDHGYLVHQCLGELFGDGAPKPFAVTRDDGLGVEVLAYSRRDGDALRDHAAAFAKPSVENLCDWRRVASKRMPDAWERGRRVGFEVRACPIVRTSRPGEDGAPLGKPREVDAFLAATFGVSGDVKLDREAVYRRWFEDELARRNAVKDVTVRVRGMSRQKILRRTQGDARERHLSDRPDVTFEGELTVDDPEAFAQFLARGVGRHRAFGFGMLLLRPATRG